MKYYLYREQSGEGCDYTIGCGSVFEMFGEFKTEQDAVDAYIFDYFSYIGKDEEPSFADPDDMLEITLYAVADEIDLMPHIKSQISILKKEWAEKSGKEAKAKKESTELAEYKRLHEKYGKNG